MRQEQFVEIHSSSWREMRDYLDRAEGKAGVSNILGRDLNDDAFAAAYRQICQHLAIARLRHYSPRVVDELHQLVLRGHNLLYRSRIPLRHRVVEFFSRGLPQVVRAERRWVLLASALFYVPLIAMALLVQEHPDLVHSLFSISDIANIESMYDSNASHTQQDRAATSDMQMFGYYILNNVGIGFRTFGAGMLFGVGAVFILLFNGLYIGTIAGHLVANGSGAQFWTFVIGHSSLELTAITLAGAAGLKLGFALVAPGRFTRREALLRAAETGVRLVYGVFVMLVLAAAVEAFWSSNGAIPAGVKWTVGVGLWALLFTYFIRGGRSA